MLNFKNLHSGYRHQKSPADDQRGSYEDMEYVPTP